MRFFTASNVTDQYRWRQMVYYIFICIEISSQNVVQSDRCMSPIIKRKLKSFIFNFGSIEAFVRNFTLNLMCLKIDKN